MPFAAAVPLITAGISGLAGLFGGRKQQQTQQNQATDQTSQQSFNQSSMPNLNPFQQQLMQMFTERAAQNANVNLAPYAQQQLQQIGQQGNLNRQVIANMLASRGLSYSPAAATPFTQNLMNVGAQQNQFLAQLPLLNRQFQDQGFENLLKAFNVIPTGMSSSGSSSGATHGTSSGQSSVSGNPIAGALSGFGSALPLAYPQLFGRQQSPAQSQSPLPWLPTNPSQTQNLSLLPFPTYSPLRY